MIKLDEKKVHFMFNKIAQKMTRNTAQKERNGEFGSGR